MAARFQGKQLRKDSQTRYLAHAFRVAMVVRHAFNGDDEIAVCAA